MKTAAASVINASASEPFMWNRMRMTSEFFRKLSLKAEKNWVQNKGAKRRVMSRDDDMAISGGSIRLEQPQIPTACRQPKRRQFGQKDNRPRRGRGITPASRQNANFVAARR